jgi:hypothetical protein
MDTQGIKSYYYNFADLVANKNYPADNAGNLGEEVVYTYLPQMRVTE